MFNRSEIMKDAWKVFHTRNELYADKIATGRVDGSFALALSIAWQRAKNVIENAAREEAMRVAEKARVAEMLAAPNGERIYQIKQAILTLDCKSFRYSITNERRALEAELQSLTQAA